MKGGRILVLLLILTGGLGVLVGGSAFYSRLLYLGLLLWTGSWLWTVLVAHSMKFQRYARVLRASVGDVFEERFILENGSILMAPWIEVANQTRLPLASGSRLFTIVPGRQKRSYIARSWLTRRGAFPLGPTKVTTGDPFGLFRSAKEFAPNQSLVIRPMIFEVKSFLYPLGLLPGGKVIRRKSPDITPHAAGVREYAHGDAMKRIHWPTSIRKNQLMVKEFEQDPQAEVWLFLDCQKLVHTEKPGGQEPLPVESMLFVSRPKFQLPPSTLEYSVSITASLAHYFLAWGRAVGFVGAGQAFTILPADRGDRQEAKILETLAFVRANGDLSIAAVVEAQASQLPQGSTAILITPTILPELVVAADDLQRRMLRPVVILLESASFNGPPGTEKLSLSLRERRVPVCQVSCNSDISLVLSDVSSEFASQDVRVWQRPVLSHLT